MKLLAVLLVFLFSASFVFTAEGPKSFGCLNQNNELVDWWVIYKEPSGLRYVYMDSSLSEPRGLGYVYGDDEKSSYINDVQYSPILNTISLAEYFTRQINGNIDYLAWNDQPRKNRTYGNSVAHAKGFLGMKYTDEEFVESFFIQHSLPRFPLQNPMASQSQNPPSRDKIFDSNINFKAQHFFCVSMCDQFAGISKKRGRNHNFLRQYKEANFFKLIRNYLIPIKARIIGNVRRDSFFGEIYSKTKSIDSTELSPFFTIQSTGTERTRLKIQGYAKTPSNKIDIYDDVTAALSIHHDDYVALPGQPLKTGHKNNKSAMLMIAQSHADMATLGINQRTLVDRKDFYSVVHVLNSSSVTLPIHVNHGKKVEEVGSQRKGKKRGIEEILKAQHHKRTYFSMYRDHSKWSVNVIYKMKGPFPALLCFYDLNRSSKQTDRGGGAFCLNSSLTGSTLAGMKLWAMFMNFQPKPSDMARFMNTDIDSIYKQLPTDRSDMDVVDSNSLSPLLYADFFSNAENESKKIYELILLNQLIPTRLIVPCPFKFRAPNESDSQELETVIPSEIPLRLHQIAREYDTTALNEALKKYKIEIRLKKDPTFETPSKSESRAMRFGERTHVLSENSKDRTNHNSSAQIDHLASLYVNHSSDDDSTVPVSDSMNISEEAYSPYIDNSPELYEEANILNGMELNSAPNSGFTLSRKLFLDSSRKSETKTKRKTKKMIPMTRSFVSSGQQSNSMLFAPSETMTRCRTSNANETPSKQRKYDHQIIDQIISMPLFTTHETFNIDIDHESISLSVDDSKDTKTFIGRDSSIDILRAESINESPHSDKSTHEDEEEDQEEGQNDEYDDDDEEDDVADEEDYTDSENSQENSICESNDP